MSNPAAADAQTAEAQTPSTTTPTIPTTMQAVVARTYGSPSVLSIEQVPTPSLAEGQVLVQVESSSLNPLDWHFLTGTPYVLRLMNGLRTPKRTIHGADVAGSVVAVGPGVQRFAVGDRVFGESGGGGFGGYTSVKETSIVHIPDGVSFEAAGVTPVAGLTALQGLRTHGRVQPGDKVLINGGAGGVGTFAVQIARALGARVTAVCSTRNVDMVRSLGADRVVDYLKDDFVASGERFDVMLDNVGNRSPAECLRVLEPHGRYVAVSGPKDNPWLDPMCHIARSALKFRRADATYHQFTASPNADDLGFLGELLATGALVPEIQRTVGLEGVGDGLVEIGTGHARAKIAVTPG